MAWSRLTPLPFGLVVIFFVLGGLRYQAAVPNIDPHTIGWYRATPNAVIEGWVVQSAQVGNKQVSLRVKVDRLSVLDDQKRVVNEVKNLQGILLVYANADTDWRYGDRIIAAGAIDSFQNDGQAYFRETLFRQGVQAVMPYAKADLVSRGQGDWWVQAAETIRRTGKQVIYRQFPQPEAALLSGILVGDDNDLPDSLQTAFKETGTAHIIAISGFNMAIMAGLLTFLTGKMFPGLWRFWVTGSGIVFYTLITGASPSVVRAAMMGMMGLMGALIGRRQMGINSLVFSAAAMTAADPFLPWDISFQLSFAATLGLVLFVDPLEQAVYAFFARWLPEDRLSQWISLISEVLLCTLAAQLTTLPVMVYHFHQLSMSAFIANVFVLPVQSGVMIIGGLALLFGMIFPPLGQLVAYIAWVLLAYTTQMVTLLAKIEGGILFLEEFPLWALLVVYLILLCLTPVVFRSLGRLRKLITPAVLILGGCLTAAFIIRMTLSMPDGKLHLTLLGGDSLSTLFIQTPDGKTLLINGATLSGDLSSDVAKRVSPVERNLDMWLVTDPSANVYREFDLLNQRFSPRMVYLAEPVYRQSSWQRQISNLVLQKSSVSMLSPGQVFDLGADGRLEVLDVNNHKVALKLQWKKLHVFIPGGSGIESLKNNLETETQGAVLILGKDDLPEKTEVGVWQVFNPQMVCVSGIQDELPDDWLANNRRGWIEMVSDGENLWVESAY